MFLLWIRKVLNNSLHCAEIFWRQSSLLRCAPSITAPYELMLLFSKSLHTFGDSNFEGVLKKEIEQFDAKLLPLQQGLSAGGYALYDTFNVMIIGVVDSGKYLQVKAGIFYHGIIAGCSCADDPSPTDVTTEYCEVLFEIDRGTGEGIVELVGE